MPSTVAPTPVSVDSHAPATAFRAAFTAHLGVSRLRVATTKTAPTSSVNTAEFAGFEFFTPPGCLCAALVVDVDRPEAVLEIFETFPTEIHPSWVIETPKGAQAGWLIDPVDLRPTAREHPIRFARAIGTSLRSAVDADTAVDAVSPSRIRNPAYTHADLRASPTPPVYRLGTLHQGLKTAGLWTTTSPTDRATLTRPVTTGAIVEGTRNVAVFDACRYAAYSGRDYEAAAWEANDRCAIPLATAEVTGIIRSVTRFIERGRRRYTGLGTNPMPTAMQEALSEMGRRGGLANTPAQQAARAKGPAAASAARKATTDKKARAAQRLRAKGHSRSFICQKLRASAATVCRWLRRYVTHPPRVSPLEHQVVWWPRWRTHVSGPRCTREIQSVCGQRPPKGHPPP